MKIYSIILLTFIYKHLLHIICIIYNIEVYIVFKNIIINTLIIIVVVMTCCVMSAKMTIKLIAGLGNIGSEYINTRHNFGAEYVKLLAKKYKILLHKNKKLYGYVGQLKLNKNITQLLIPRSYMNESGLSISTCANIYQLSPEEILVAHDDLDLLPGKIRIKLGKKFNDSHHGVQDVVIKLNNKFNFYRLRIGIGRPADKNKIINFVLTKPSIYEYNSINSAIHEAIRYTENIVFNDFAQVMNKLHAYYSGCN